MLRAGGLVVFPTETVYGLGANAFSDEACRAIFAAKGRPPDNPLIVHVADLAAVERVAREVPAAARRLFQAFSPGPLTVILARNPEISSIATAGLDTVAVRIPSHPTARAMLSAAALPVAAPSANLSGKPSPTDAGSAARYMEGRVDAILDGGECESGVESTIVRVVARESGPSGEAEAAGAGDPASGVRPDRPAGEAAAGRSVATPAEGAGDPGSTGPPPASPTDQWRVEVLREGAITHEMIRELLGESVEIRGRAGRHVLAPGTAYRHYEPAARCVVAERQVLAQAVTRELERQRGLKVGVIALAKTLEGLPERENLVLVPVVDLVEYGRELYRTLQRFDEAGCELIVAEWPPSDGFGRALRDRLWRATGGVLIRDERTYLM